MTTVIIMALLAVFALLVCPASMIAVIVLSWAIWGAFGLKVSVIATAITFVVLFAVCRD